LEKDAGVSTTKSALLVMDVQRVVLNRYGNPRSYLETLKRATAAARSAGVPVVYVMVSFRRGYPEISSRNHVFSAIAASGDFLSGDENTAIHPEVAPQEDDIVVVKHRASAFAGSDLDLVLAGLQVEALVLVGLSTSGVVLSTVRAAADRDFKLKVLADGCLDGDLQIHALLVEKVFPKQAEVLTVDAWIEQLSASNSMGAVSAG
jgi:nicotinamidase-related amidase